MRLCASLVSLLSITAVFIVSIDCCFSLTIVISFFTIDDFVFFVHCSTFVASDFIDSNDDVE